MATLIKTLKEGSDYIYPRTKVDAISNNDATPKTLQQLLDEKQAVIDASHKLSADLVDNGTNNKVFTTAEKTKLAGIETGAQVNTVTSVAGRTGAVTLTKTDVGLGNVDNTTDLNKPISTATQTALNTKEETSNKVTSLTSSSTNTQYPGAKVVYDEISTLKQNIKDGNTTYKVYFEIQSDNLLHMIGEEN